VLAIYHPACGHRHVLFPPPRASPSGKIAEIGEYIGYIWCTGELLHVYVGGKERKPPVDRR